MTIESVIARNRRRLLTNVEGPLVRLLLREYGGVIARLGREAESLARSISGEPTRAQLLRMRRIDALTQQVEAEMGQVTRRAAGAIREQRQLAIIGSMRDVHGVAAEVGVSLNPAAVERIVGALQPGSPLQALVAELPGQAAGAVREALIEGVATGKNPRIVARGVRQALGGQSARALTIARTEVLRSYRGAALETFRENSDDLGGWVWLSAQDLTTCAFCWSQHGEVFPLSEPFASHPNCIPAGAVVAGPRVIGSTTRWFEGEVVELYTAGRHRLTVTPNHPVLTPHGWIAAGLLDVGSSVISSSRGEGRLPGVNPDEQQAPALIEDIAESFGRAGGVPPRSMPTAAEDFHGDGVGSEVHVIRAYGLLGDGLDLSLMQPFGEQGLCGRHTEAALLTRARALDEFDEGTLLASDRFMCSHRSEAALLRRFGGGGDAVCLGDTAALYPGGVEPVHHDGTREAHRRRDTKLGVSGRVSADDFVGVDFYPGPVIAEGDAPIDERSVNDSTVYAEPSRESLARFAGQVIADELISVERRAFTGHVYNLETTDGWYTANSIITHNCRCSPGPLPRTAPPRIERGEDAFARLPDTQQLQVLGPAKFRAYQDGAIGLGDLVGHANDPRWGRVGFERPLRDVLGRSRAVGFYRGTAA